MIPSARAELTAVIGQLLALIGGARANDPRRRSVGRWAPTRVKSGGR